MQKLYAILITKNDDRIIKAWFDRHAAGFDAISVVDGSDNLSTREICLNYPNVIYRQDPEGAITDQTLRHAAMQSLRPQLQPNDWIFIAHPDEHLLHHPRQFMQVPMPLILWLPLVVLPHPSERALATEQSGQAFHPGEIFKHYWWRTGQLPHCEFRMFRLVKPDWWDLDNPKKSTSVIPANFADLPVCNLFPLYLHYKLYNIDLGRYHADGHFLDSGLGTGINQSVRTIDDLFFDEHRPWGDGYTSFERQSANVFAKFGNPPRGISDANGQVKIVNDQGRCIHA